MEELKNKILGKYGRARLNFILKITSEAYMLNY